MIKLFKVDPMTYTPFSSEQTADFFRKRGIIFTNNKYDCDIFVSRYSHGLSLRILFPFKKYLVWTHEPRHDQHLKSKLNGFLCLPDVSIMNAYTEDIYLNNYGIYGKAVDQVLEPLNEKNFSGFKHKKIVALMMYRNNQKKWSLKKDGKELDLCYLRTRIALEGYNLNKVDIYGKGWPKGISREDSRDNNWKKRKSVILQEYHYNLCFENTNADYYCTEKIWDSIKGGCLPIYYGKENKIYEDFPKNSFLDYCDFKSTGELFDYIENMDKKEFIERMNLCINVFNEVYNKRKIHKFYDKKYDEEMLLKIVYKINEMVGSANFLGLN